MARSGPEAKLAWRDIPRPIREAAEAVLGAPVRRGVPVWGGYAPSITCRLLLADGRRAFFKAMNDDASAATDEVMRRAFVQEERVYRELGERIAPWAPAFYGAFAREDWRVLLLEDLGPATVPPWTAPRARLAARDYADFHRATLGTPLPDWLSRDAHRGLARHWDRLVEEPGGLASVASLAGDRAAEARDWLDRALPRLRAASRALADAPEPHALLHFDTRSDNLRIRDGRLRLFDWPWAVVGPPELDAVFFFQSVPLEAGGPPPEQLLAWYEERLPLRAAVVSGAIAASAGFFAHHAWRPPIPALPRLRGFQRRQLASCLAWAARRLDLPASAWLDPARTIPYLAGGGACDSS